MEGHNKLSLTITDNLLYCCGRGLVANHFIAGAHPGGGKAFMSLCGIDCGPPRLPILPLTDESIKSLESDLRDIGFFEWS